MQETANIYIRADQVCVGDFITSIDYDYMRKCTRLEVLPSGDIMIHMGNQIRSTQATTQVGVRR